MEDVFVVANQDDLKALVIELEATLTRQQKMINKKRTAIQKSRVGDKPLANKNLDDSLLIVMRNKYKQLTKELHSAESNRPFVLPSEILVDVVLEDKLKKSIRDIESCILRERKKKSELQIELQRIDDSTAVHLKFCATLESHKEVMEDKLAALQRPASDISSDSELSHSASLVTERELVQKLHSMEAKIAEITGTLGNEPEIKYLPFQEMIMLLINKSLNSPHDTYVTVDDTWYPPYLESLLRHDVAVHHPQRRNKVRLENYR